MLARLEAIDGVDVAEVDHRGELLRLSLTSEPALQDALETLRDLGYAADRLADPPQIARWYGRDTVRELSREEADIIARRVVAAFVRTQALPTPTMTALEDVVARALSTYFTMHTLDRTSAIGALRREAAETVEAAAGGLLGGGGARALARALRADLDRAASVEGTDDATAS